MLIAINHHFTEQWNLKVKSNYHVTPVDECGINVVGYISFRNHSRARKRNKQELCRRVAKLRKKGVPDDIIRLKLAGRIGFMKHCNSKHLIKTLGMDLTKIKSFDEVVDKDECGGEINHGPKMKIANLFNRPLIIQGYEIGKSNKNDQDRLTIYFLIEEEVVQQDGTKTREWVEHIVWTSAERLKIAMKGTKAFPFKGMIK